MLEREIRFTPAFDKRSDDPSKNYGIGTVKVYFYLKGEKGTIQFVFLTDWYLPYVKQELRHTGRMQRVFADYPMASDLCYHSPTPMYDGQDPITDDCELTGGVCYYDGTALGAEPVMDLLVSEGSEAVWKRLEEEYEMRFGDKNEIL
jgi:hypothetical protein